MVHQQEHAQGIFLRLQASEQERRDKPEWAVDKAGKGSRVGVDTCRLAHQGGWVDIDIGM